jgi:hypothetical protein
LPTPAQTQTVTLEIQPATIAVSPSYGEVQARAVLKNGTTKPIRQLELSAFNNDGLQISIGKPSTPSALAGQSVVWTLKITDPAHARLPASAQFEVKYREMDQSACFRAFAALAVSSAADSKPVEISVEGNFDSISQQRPGEGALLVTNNLDLPVDIRIETLPGSASMRIDSIQPFQIPPRSTVRKAIKVSTDGRVTPGAYPAAFEVTPNGIGPAERGAPPPGKQTGDHRCLFESELLKALHPLVFGFA